MWKAILITLLLFAVTVPAQVTAQVPWQPPPRGGGAYLNLTGTWYMQGNARLPAYIEQRSPNEALFINEHGDRAWGTIEGDRVFIPDWSDGRGRGLVGFIQGWRIVWPNRTYWSREPEWNLGRP